MTRSLPWDRQELSSWARELRLPEGTVATLCESYAPLSSWLATRWQRAGRPLVVGIDGAQGTGKSTALWLLMRLLPRLHGLRVAGLSLDDLYLTAAERESLARRVHPLLRTRGVPGTHDVELAHRVLDALTHDRAGAGEYSVVTFDKAQDDRAPPEHWPRVRVPNDVALLEGWCVGARPQAASALAQPINQLERERDADGTWRRYINDQLAGDYAALFDRLDVLVMLEAPDLACVRRWRREQEEALRRKLSAQGKADTTMDDAAIDHFVQYFERLTRAMLEETPLRADVVFELDRDHGIVKAHYTLRGH